MKKTYLHRGFAPFAIIIIIIVALAIGGGVYYSVKKNKNATPENTTAEGSPTPAITPEFGVDADAQASLNLKTGTLRSLLSLGKDQVCTFDSGTSSNGTSGTMYISGTMMRGDFTSQTSSGATVDSHMIRQGDVVFVWSGSQGAKMGMAQMNANSSSRTNGSVNLDQSVNYKCSDWRKDATKFSAPSTVNFVDLGAMMNGQVNVNTGAGY